MTASYYSRKHLPSFSTIGQGQPELAKKFFDYYGAVFADGALSVREKSLAALAVAHVVQCPYCIDAYTRGSLEAGADLSQLSEAVHVASVVRGAASLRHGIQMLGQATQLEMGATKAAAVSDSYYDRTHADRFDALRSGEAELFDRHEGYAGAVFSAGALSTREKQLIAVGCAHGIQCPYSIEHHTTAAIREGATIEQLTEVVHVAAAIRGGASLIHGLQMLEQTKKLTM